MEPRVVASSGDEVVVLWRQRGRSPSGERFDGPVLALYTIHDGKLARAQMFYFDTAAVVEFLERGGRPGCLAWPQHGPARYAYVTICQSGVVGDVAGISDATDRTRTASPRRRRRRRSRPQAQDDTYVSGVNVPRKQYADSVVADFHRARGENGGR